MIVNFISLFISFVTCPPPLRLKTRPRTTARPASPTTTSRAPLSTTKRQLTTTEEPSLREVDPYSTVSKRLCTHLLGGLCDRNKVLKIVDQVKGIVEGRDNCGPKLRPRECHQEAKALLSFMMQVPRLSSRFNQQDGLVDQPGPSFDNAVEGIHAIESGISSIMSSQNKNKDCSSPDDSGEE